MEKTRPRRAWMQIVAMFLAVVMVGTMIPAEALAAAGSDMEVTAVESEETAVSVIDEAADGEVVTAGSYGLDATVGAKDACDCTDCSGVDDCICEDCYGGIDCTCDNCTDLCDCGSVPEDTDEYGSVTGDDSITDDVDEAVAENGAINADKAAAKKPVIKSAEFFHNEDGTYEVQLEYEGNEGDYNVELYNVKPAKNGDPKTELGLAFVDGKPYHIIGIMTIDQSNNKKYYKNDKGRWVIKDTLYYVKDSDKPAPGSTTQFTVGTIGPNNNSELAADPISIKVPEKGKKTTAKPGSSDPGPVDTTPDLGKARLVGINTDEIHQYTEKEAKRIGLEKPDGTPLVKGKDYTEEITTSEDGENWLIKYKPVEDRTKGDEISVEVKKAPANVHNVTVNYVLPVTGQPVAPAVVRSYPEGTGFSIESPTVAVPTAEGKYYTPSRRYVNGHMGTEDLEYSVEYTYQEITALTWFTVEVNYVIENKEGDTTQAPPKVKQYRHGNEAYSIESPPVEGYLPDAKCVSGTVPNQNVAETVTYRPKYRVKIVRKTGFGGETDEWILADDEYPDGAAYSYDLKELLVRQAAGSEESGTAVRNAWASETAMRAAWTVSPAQVSGTIRHEDVEVIVTVTCSHPQSSHLYIDMDDETHSINCRICGQSITESEAHIYGESVFMTPEELAEAFPYGGTRAGYKYSLEAYKRDYPGGASTKICKKCGHEEITDTNEERCPASPADENYKHLWSRWEKINDNQCSRTCARCKKTETVSHAWGNWESATSKTHVRRCSLCHCSETGDHGAWRNINVKKPATCIENAEVSATCGICNNQINNVYFGIVPTMGKDYEKQGHQFDGGLVKIHGGHTQKCSVCGAFDMEHLQEHVWEDVPLVTTTGECGNGQIIYTYDCVCGAKRTETAEWKHRFVRDKSRETGATCEQPGTECYTCSECGATDDKVVDALGHNWVEDEGNYPAECEKEGRMWFHCSNPGCDATKKEDCPKLSKTGKHNWVPHVVSKASCTSGGIITGSDCTICHKRDWDGHIEWVDRLPHDLDVTTVTRTEPFISETGSSAGTKEVTTVTARCKSCGYNFPKAVYTVTKSPAINKYSVDPGNVTLTDLSDGIHVDQQFGKDGGVHFNKVADGALMEAVNNLLNIYRRKEGSVITEFTQEFMNSLEDGEYEVIQVNGDEIAAATLKVQDHKFVDHPNAVEGKQPGITALSDWEITDPENDTKEDKFEKSEKITVNGEEVDYYPYMSDGELLFYLGEIENNPAPIDFDEEDEEAAALAALTVRADPIVFPEVVEYDGVGNVVIEEDSVDPEEPLGIRFAKSDKGHTLDTENPINLDGYALPAVEEVRSTVEGQETEERTNYRIKDAKVTFTREFLDELGEGEHPFTVNYTDGLQAMGVIVVPPAFEEDQTVLTLSSTYVVLEKGEQIPLEPTRLDDVKKAEVVWTIVDADNNPSEVVSFSESSHLVTALKKGTCWITATYERKDGKGTLTARCRVDVHDPLAVSSVSLLDKKKTVELYSTNYASVDIYMDIATDDSEMPHNGISADGIAKVGASPDNGGCLIHGAVFEDKATAEVFDLVAKDDSTLLIVPKSEYVYGSQDKIGKLKKTYKSKIKVTTGYGYFSTGTLTITLKKNKPGIKAAKVSFNSSLEENKKTVKFKGGSVTYVEPRAGMPAWIGIDGNDLVYKGVAGKKINGNAKLTVTVKGWAVKVPVTVKVSAAPVAAGIKIKAKSITLNPGAGDSAVTAVNIGPSVYADEYPDIVITESGKNVTNGEQIECAYYDRKLHIQCADTFDSSNAHTYKVMLKLRGKTASVTVKTLAADKKPGHKIKASGSIDAAIVKSPVILKATPVNYNSGAGMTYEARAVKSDDKTKAEEDITELFDVKVEGNTITLTEKIPGSLDKGYTYYAYTKGITAKGEETAEVKTKLNVKWSVKVPKRSVSLKVKGSIDVVRPESSIQVTATVKNFYDYALTPDNLIIYKIQGKKAKEAGTGETNEFFDVTCEGNTFIIKLKDGAGINHLTDKFSVGLKIGEEVKSSTPKSIKIKMGKTKFRTVIDPAAFKKRDDYSRKIVTIQPAQSGLSEIDKVVIVSPKDKKLKKYNYVLNDLGNGEYAIRYNEYNAAFAKSGTVKLKVYLKGNNTAGTKKDKPNATIKVKVTVK